MQDIEDFDKQKTRVLKYVLYKKRTEQEVRQKFIDIEAEMLDEIIGNLIENDYINDCRYIDKAVKEFIALKNLSVRELEYKLLSKGLSKSSVEDYISEHIEKLKEYELNSANSIYLKKLNKMKYEDVFFYLRKKGYKEETIRSLQNNE